MEAKHVIATLTTVLLLIACSTSPHFGDSYTVIIDPSFDETDAASFPIALQSWEALAAGHLHFTSRVAKPGDCSSDKPGQICIIAASLAEVGANDNGSGTGWLGFTNINDNGGSHIYMSVSNDTKFSTDQFATIVAHELGHAMGLAHTLPTTFTVMLPGWYSEGKPNAPLPTCNDYAQFADVRGISHVNASCPSGGSYVLNGDGTD